MNSNWVFPPLNEPSLYANQGDERQVGISGYLLPSGYAHFADQTQEHGNRGGWSYIETFPSGWDEIGDRSKEYYQSAFLIPEDYQYVFPDYNKVCFPIYTSGINDRNTPTDRRLTLFDPPLGRGTDEKGATSGMFSSNRVNYEYASGDGRNLTASGFKDQGSIFNRGFETDNPNYVIDFMFMDGMGYGANCSQSSNGSSSTFNLNNNQCTPTPFKYIWENFVKPSSVFEIFSGIFPVGGNANPLPTNTVPNQGVPLSGEVELHGHGADPKLPDVSDDFFDPDDPPEFGDPGMGAPNPNPPEE